MNHDFPSWLPFLFLGAIGGVWLIGLAIQAGLKKLGFKDKDGVTPED